ncbi:MarR family winged helix-turn-helix transcriptional regulator [Clostridium formicaceticum]|uniref:Transcriptional regulator SlyA n=1 Tax=Clostridium formicaceticum TaxID=1497 RepID=A0AAC9WH95_9CLOT|nr:MarR family transcriptional regulator [Clostridium formicaceticum]AOY74531.1 hypothetical protein BJL90_00325 [Clostridium formicaceticum]ARE88887.1 Transcriptional regulator SlyA [Clostridium formicaceticum]
MDPLMKYISRTSRCAALYRSDVLEAYGLNGYQHSYILNICQHPGISQDQLARIIYVNKSNVTRQLALLEDNGFITRTPCENDRRQRQVYPTEKAMQVYPKVREALYQLNAYLLEDFSEEEKELLMIMMKKVMHKAAKLVEKNLEGSSEKR